MSQDFFWSKGPSRKNSWRLYDYPLRIVFMDTGICFSPNFLVSTWLEKVSVVSGVFVWVREASLPKRQIAQQVVWKSSSPKRHHHKQPTANSKNSSWIAGRIGFAWKHLQIYEFPCFCCWSHFLPVWTKHELWVSLPDCLIHRFYKRISISWKRLALWKNTSDLL